MFEQELVKELEEEVHANRQRVEHMSRSHEQQLKELQQVPLLSCFCFHFFDLLRLVLLCRRRRSARLSCCSGGLRCCIQMFAVVTRLCADTSSARRRRAAVCGRQTCACR